ncbi:hypothetical protein MmiAt1_08500 [Methanimicrococcus sp. At1]|uniref:Secreted protein n=1 Tax=Methanimicrococcus hacksteinii TaxID=3028293 RepID=A0ABU3VPD0_9EURY|nr:hypothetical protein [Methanimicrococcus sp. At1]MDV0445282.1 hypothetical protein [Methanimicrococcus sp. At1]
MSFAFVFYACTACNVLPFGPSMHAAVRTKYARCRSDQICTLPLGPSMHAAVRTKYARCRSDQICTLPLGPSMHAAVRTKYARCRSDQICTLPFGPSMHAAARISVRAAIWIKYVGCHMHLLFFITAVRYANVGTDYLQFSVCCRYLAVCIAAAIAATAVAATAACAREPHRFLKIYKTNPCFLKIIQNGPVFFKNYAKRDPRLLKNMTKRSVFWGEIKTFLHILTVFFSWNLLNKTLLFSIARGHWLKCTA